MRKNVLPCHPVDPTHAVYIYGIITSLPGALM